MLQICAWCKKQIGTVSQTTFGDDVVSHGICKDCVDNLTFQKGVPLQRYLDALREPVMLMTGDGVVCQVNSAACRLLGKEATAVERQLAGDVFECAYARLPEGCGRTIHCSGCTLRRAVTETHQTGIPRYRIPATLSREDPDHPGSITMYITTVKVGDVVLLRLDRLDEQGASACR